MSTPLPFWPCPDSCHLWARSFYIDKPQTNHHPRCAHVDASLIDVWRIRTEVGSIIVDAEPCPEELPDGATVEKVKMHREIYNATPEFQG